MQNVVLYLHPTQDLKEMLRYLQHTPDVASKRSPKAQHYAAMLALIEVCCCTAGGSLLFLLARTEDTELKMYCFAFRCALLNVQMQYVVGQLYENVPDLVRFSCSLLAKLRCQRYRIPNACVCMQEKEPHLRLPIDANRLKDFQEKLQHLQKDIQKFRQYLVSLSFY